MTDSELKTCPYCAETIKAAAIKCRYCHSDLNTPKTANTLGDLSQEHAKQTIFTPSRHQDPSTQKQFTIALDNATDQPFDQHLHELLLYGQIENKGTVHSSFCIYLIGFQAINGVPHTSGCLASVTTEVLRPGQTVTWVAAMYPVLERFPTEFRYEVVQQARPGLYEDIPSLSREDIAIAGPAGALLTQQFATRLRGITQVPESGTLSLATKSHAGVQSESQRPPIWPHLDKGIRLSDWKGVSRITRKETLSAYCKTCQHSWELDSAAANTLAQEQGMLGKLQRGGTKLEQQGATFSFFSGRRIAAGNEHERLSGQLGYIRSLCACPLCQSHDVLLAPPH